MSETPPPPNPPQPPVGGPPPPEPPPGQYGQPFPQTPPEGQYGAPGAYGAPPAGGTRPGELLDRFLARLIDGVLFAIVSFVLGLIFAAVLLSDPSVNLATGEVDTGSRFLYNLVSALVSTAIVLGYYAFLESSRGQTVGKMVMKLKVVGPDGGNPTLAQAAKRNIWLALGLLGLLGTIGTVLNLVASIAAIVIIVMGINSLPRRQHKFDEFAGGTQVLKIG